MSGEGIERWSGFHSRASPSEVIQVPEERCGMERLIPKETEKRAFVEVKDRRKVEIGVSTAWVYESYSV